MRRIIEVQTKTGLVHDELRGAILRGEFAPGARVNADDIADRLGTSKVPVREAILRLAGEGWLELRPHAGAIVPIMSPEEIVDTAVLRAAVENAAVRLAVPRHTPESAAALRKLLRRMDVAARTNSATYPDLNAEFHCAVLAPCPYPMTRKQAEVLIHQAVRFRPVRFMPDYLLASQEEHRQISDAVLAGDSCAAAELTRDHVMRAANLLYNFILNETGNEGTQGDQHTQLPA